MSNYRELEARIRALERDLSRGARTVRFGAVSKNRIEDDTDGGVNNSNGSSCDEMSCLNIPGLTDDLCKNLPLWPEYYEFELPSLDCRCTPSGAERTVKLYSTAADNVVWESKHGDSDPEQFTCKASNHSLEACTNTATWRWTVVTLPNICSGHYDWHVDSFGNWAFGNASGIQTDPCHCSETGAICGDNGSTPTDSTAGLPVGYEITKPCCNELGPNPADCNNCGYIDSGSWVLQSVSNEDCDCTPVEPDFDGSEDGDTATTTCTGTAPTACAEIDVVSFWRLTIGSGVDYYGQPDPTTLELITGSDTRLLLYLDNPHRAFCPSCVNSFRTATCKACRYAPSIICVIPRLVGGLSSCAYCKDAVVPSKYLLYLTSAGGDVIGPLYLAMTEDGSCRGRLEIYAWVGSNPSDDLWGWLQGNIIEIKIDFSGIYTVSVESGSTQREIYQLTEDITTGDGCNQVLNFTSLWSEGVSGLNPPDGSTLTLYPIPEDPLA